MIDRQTSIAIDSLRVVCCGIVVASHAYEFLTGQLADPVNETISYIAVAVFFFLSGYVNQVSFTAKPNYRAFLWSRAKRLLPLYYYSLIVSLVLAYSLGLFTPTDLLNLVFLQSIAVPTVVTNGPLWSLAWEMVLYLAFPLVLAGVNRPALYLVPLVALMFLFGRHQWLFFAFVSGVAASAHGMRFPKIILLPSAGRWTYEVYCLHYPVLFLIALSF